MTLSLYFHTLRFLKPVQFTGRLSKRFRKLDSTSSDTSTLRKAKGGWVEARLARQSLLSDQLARFLNQEGSTLSWNDPQQEKLWLYNLHYFDDLNSINAVERTALHRRFIARWIKENPAPQGNGWEPYPLSLRIVNWVKWFKQGQSPEPLWLESLALQTKLLSQTLEHHLLGNHLFANAKALLFAGLYFEGHEADTWLNTALEILDREIPEQILADGGNFELSPMYHATITQDMLDLINIAQCYQHPELAKRLPAWKMRVSKMLIWLEVMTHPDGQVSFFNDSAQGIAPTFTQLKDYAEPLGITPIGVDAERSSVQHLEETGYVRINSNDAVALLDVAKVGPDYIPGHAHADSLSFEFSVFGKRLLVNSGTSCYGTSSERLRQRGTAAHNTVLINNENSSVVWGGFRVAQRAYPQSLEIEEAADRIRVACSHTGYRWLKGKPQHHREWKFGERTLSVTDTLSGRFNKAQARYHLHPDWRAELKGNQLVCLNGDGDRVVIEIEQGQATLEESTYHPEFGLSILNKVLAVDFDSASTQVFISW